jgi:hypothetical protein
MFAHPSCLWPLPVDRMEGARFPRECRVAPIHPRRVVEVAPFVFLLF